MQVFEPIHSPTIEARPTREPSSPTSSRFSLRQLRPRSPAGYALAGIGFTSTVAQLLMMREFVATFYGNELLFGLVLMAWLLWVAVGAWGLVRLAQGPGFGLRQLALGLAAVALLLPIQVAFIRGARNLFDVTPGALVEFGPTLASTMLVPAPLCILLGLLFGLGVRLSVARGETAGRAYAWETVGAVTGGVFFSFLFIHWTSPFQTALLVSAINLAAAVHLFLLPNSRSPRYALALAVVLAAAALMIGKPLNMATLRWQWKDLAFAIDSPYGRLLVLARDGQRVFVQNGLLAFETQTTFPEEAVHFPMLAHPRPSSVLLIGGGVSGNVREALKHAPETVVYVEIDPAVISAAQTQLPAEDAAVLTEKHAHSVLDDGRRYVNSTQRRFDVVVVDLPPPTTGALNRFYTSEFFSMARERLKPGGILALGLPGSENYWSQELARRNLSVFRTLQSVFSHTLAISAGTHDFFLASDSDLAVVPALLSRRLSERGIATQQVTPGYIDYVLGSKRFEENQAGLGSGIDIQINTDLHPISYFYDLVLWISYFSPQMGRLLSQIGSIPLSWLLPALLLVAAAGRLRRNWALPVAIGSIGFTAMILEVLILFSFQSLHGTAYAQVSVIVTCFMAGLAVGAVAANSWLARATPATSSRKLKQVLVSIMAIIATYCGLLLAVVHLPFPAPAGIFPFLALLIGALAGAAFPLAVSMENGHIVGVVGRLYGADLIGGCIGAGIGATFLLPLMGIPQMCVLAALACLAGLLALI